MSSSYVLDVSRYQLCHLWVSSPVQRLPFCFLVSCTVQRLFSLMETDSLHILNEVSRQPLPFKIHALSCHFFHSHGFWGWLRGGAPALWGPRLCRYEHPLTQAVPPTGLGGALPTSALQLPWRGFHPSLSGSRWGAEGMTARNLMRRWFFWLEVLPLQSTVSWAHGDAVKGMQLSVQWGRSVACLTFGCCAPHS